MVLAAPLVGDGWLAERLARFGESPCAFLLGAPDFQTACRRFGLATSSDWFGRRVAWFDVTRLRGTPLGVTRI